MNQHPCPICGEMVELRADVGKLEKCESCGAKFTREVTPRTGEKKDDRRN